MIAEQESVAAQSAELAAEYEADTDAADERERDQLAMMATALRQDEAIALAELDRLKQIRATSATT